MIRIGCVVACLPLLSACSLGTQTLSYGLNDSATPAKASAPTFSQNFGPPPTRNRAGNSRQQVAALNRPGRPGAAASTTPRADVSQLDIERARTKINAYRKSKGLRPLSMSAELTKAAKAHSRDLAKWDRISHYGSDGSNPWDRVKRTGFKAQLAAENVGTGQKTFDEVLVGWKNSPGHDKNLLLPDATHMGLALVTDPKTEYKTFWTLVLGTPTSRS